MKRNVMSWDATLRDGYEPRLYSYKPADIPAGETGAVPDFKVWAKWTPGISCYFTETGTGRKFQLTVFRDYQTEEYRLKGNEIDLTSCPVGVMYAVRVTPNRKERMVFEHAELIEAG